MPEFCCCVGETDAICVFFFCICINVESVFTDKDEEEGCRYLALWFLQEDCGRRRLDLQVGYFFCFAAFLSPSSNLTACVHPDGGYCHRGFPTC